MDWIPGQQTKIPHAMQHSQKKTPEVVSVIHIENEIMLLEVIDLSFKLIYDVYTSNG